MNRREFALRQAESYAQISKDAARVEQYLNDYVQAANEQQPLFRSVAELDRVRAVRDWLEARSTP